MKRLIITAAAVLLTATACSDDRMVGSIEKAEQEINFRSLTDKHTRAAITDGGSILGFTLMGWWYKTGSMTIGDSEGTYLFNAFDITRGEGGVSWDYSPKRFWPTSGTVDFIAYSPASSKNLTNGLLDFDATKRLTYTVPDVAVNDAQEDFMVAAALGKTSGVVNMNFHHALSRVLFEAKKTNKEVIYEIGEIKLANITTTADLDLVTDKAQFNETGGFTYPGTGDLVIWTGHTGTKDVVVDMNGSPVNVIYNTFTPVMGTQNALMVMPQKTLNTSFRVKVKYKAYLDGIYYAGSETTYAELDIPLHKIGDVPGTDFIFEIGRQYTFRLTFGDEIGDPITFTVDVDNWDLTQVIEIPQP